MIPLMSKTVSLRNRFLNKVIEMKLDENPFMRIFKEHIRSNKSECKRRDNLLLTRKGLIALIAFPKYEFYASFWPIFSSWNQFYT